MGRTNPTFRKLLRAVQEQYGDYRSALRRKEQPYFDQLFEHAEAHADASGYMNPDNPMEPILVSMVLEQQKQLAELQERIRELEAE